MGLSATAQGSRVLVDVLGTASHTPCSERTLRHATAGVLCKRANAPAAQAGRSIRIIRCEKVGVHSCERSGFEENRADVRAAPRQQLTEDISYSGIAQASQTPGARWQCCSLPYLTFQGPFHCTCPVGSNPRTAAVLPVCPRNTAQKSSGLATLDGADSDQVSDQIHD